MHCSSNPGDNCTVHGEDKEAEEIKNGLTTKTGETAGGQRGSIISSITL